MENKTLYDLDMLLDKIHEDVRSHVEYDGSVYSEELILSEILKPLVEEVSKWQSDSETTMKHIGEFLNVCKEFEKEDCGDGSYMMSKLRSAVEEDKEYRQEVYDIVNREKNNILPFWVKIFYILRDFKLPLERNDFNPHIDTYNNFVLDVYRGHFNEHDGWGELITATGKKTGRGIFTSMKDPSVKVKGCYVAWYNK